jgi:hypothetical protein
MLCRRQGCWWESIRAMYNIRTHQSGVLIACTSQQYDVSHLPRLPKLGQSTTVDRRGRSFTGLAGCGAAQPARHIGTMVAGTGCPTAAVALPGIVPRAPGCGTYHFLESQPMMCAQLSTLVDNAIVVWQDFHVTYSGRCCDLEGGEGCSCHEHGERIGPWGTLTVGLRWT